MATKDDEIREGYDELTLSAIEYAINCEDGSEEKSKACDEASKLFRARQEQTKIDNDAWEQDQRRIEEIEKRKADMKFKEKELKVKHKEFVQKMAMDAALTSAKLVTFGIVGRWAGNLETIGSMSTNLAKSIFREGMGMLGLKR